MKVFRFATLSFLLMSAFYAHADSRPAALESLEARGPIIEKEFEAPDGLVGYAGQANGQPVILYAVRSEERRVGQGGRCRWVPDQVNGNSTGMLQHSPEE